MVDYRNVEYELAKGLLIWYPFSQGNSVLVIGENNGMADMIREKGAMCTCVSEEESEKCEGDYDYIIAITGLEKVDQPIHFLKVWRKLLKQDGCLLLGMNNRMGIKYFCGDRDPYTNKPFDGIDHYMQSDRENRSGRCYGAGEIAEFLQRSQFCFWKRYSVFPDLAHPQLIYANDVLPNEELASRLFPVYNCVHTPFLIEEALYSGLIKNGLFHEMANAYLYECKNDTSFADVSRVTLSLERGKESGCVTIVHADQYVEKRAISEAGFTRLQCLVKHGEELSDNGISIVKQWEKDQAIVSDYVQAVTAQIYLKELLFADQKLFLKEMERFVELIKRSSVKYMGHVEGIDEEVEIFEKGYIELVPANCLYVDGEFVFFDQEYCMKDCPVNVLVARALSGLYFGNPAMEQVIPLLELFAHFGLEKNSEKWMGMELELSLSLRKEQDEEVQEYHRRVWRDFGQLVQNRKRVNEQYMEERMVGTVNEQDWIEKRVIVFGTGKYAEQFYQAYSDRCQIVCVLDNNPDKQGQLFHDIKICPANRLCELSLGEHVLMICVRDCEAIIRQVEAYRFWNYYVYRPQPAKPKERMSIRVKDAENDASKQYHIGYVAGAFDMFHIGHLNLLRRAKEQCDYLIVGVISDEKMKQLKGKAPVIPCHERMQVIAGCRYVDQVEELPIDRAGIGDAYRMFHFDCMFSGDDHKDDPAWLAEQRYLREQGSDIVFVSYTKEQSSTEIRKKMNQN